MAVKNAVSRSWVISPSADGKFWSAWPGGDKPAGGAFALEFPSNSTATNTTDPYAVLEFVNPQSDGLPIWGASGAGITVVRKLRTKATLQPGYNALHWWSQGDRNFVGSNGNWGAHPYPADGFARTNNYGPGGTGYYIHSLATAGKDIVEDGTAWAGSGGNPSAPTLAIGYAVNASTTYVQGLRITRNNASSKDFAYYTNLPSTAAADVITHTETTTDYGETNPPSPKFTIGDSPWYASHQHERADCILDAIKIFNAVLSEADMLSEAADFSQIVTTAGQAAIWWGRDGFATGHDADGASVVCSYGTGRAFTVLNESADSAQRINLVARL